MKNVETVFVKSKYLQLNELGCKFNLSFSSQLVLGDKVIALDGIKRKLLVWEVNSSLDAAYVIDLNQVSSITLRQIYRSINHGELKHKEIGEFLERTDLQFNYRNTDVTHVVTFYDNGKHPLSDRQKLERNAKIWQMVLSKMLEPKMEKLIMK
ncbi:hypothetical protein [Niastella populi]|uniref:Uncharacterized protein n=1 Tax=Niastella populi TaxID=550983 RepID=A0A1V9FBL4_9BACT|nr:hypothetical protein [Niastella populi]OQP55773.1 hypothetical protein A4R26_27110 [Niastella populi]